MESPDREVPLYVYHGNHISYAHVWGVCNVNMLRVSCLDLQWLPGRAKPGSKRRTLCTLCTELGLPHPDSTFTRPPAPPCHAHLHLMPRPPVFPLHLMPCPTAFSCHAHLHYMPRPPAQQSYDLNNLRGGRGTLIMEKQCFSEGAGVGWGAWHSNQVCGASVTVVRECSEQLFQKATLLLTSHTHTHTHTPFHPHGKSNHFLHALGQVMHRLRVSSWINCSVVGT